MTSLSDCRNAERIHRVFRGSTEKVKWIKFVALFTEITSALFAGWRILHPELEWSGWASLGLTTVVSLGIGLRIWARTVNAFSERCRRIAIKAYGLNLDVPAMATSSLLADAPSFSDWFSKQLPAQTLQDYYESTTPPGNSRLRELYAHSAFYSWKLLRVCGYIYFIGALAFCVCGFLVIYGLAVQPNDPTTSGRVLDLVCSIIFVFFAAKAVVACIEAKQSSNESRRITESLLNQTANDDPRDLMTDYDIEISNGITIPTPIYLRMRDILQRQWHEIRAGLA